MHRCAIAACAKKAFGGIGGALVGAKAFAYTRGQPAHFQSSSRARRGFCDMCGTPLTFETQDTVDFAIAAFDHPQALPPVIQLSLETRLPWVDGIAALPTRTPAEAAKFAPIYAGLVSYQHPDHDTDAWQPQRAPRA